jgi:flagellar hook-associated protein 1 FlgK
VKSFQQPDGTVTVYLGSDYLVSKGQARTVSVNSSQVNGESVSQLRLTDTNSALEITTGEVAGLVKSRDQILGGFLDQLNSFTKTMTYEFNKVYASGQGLTGYSSTKSEFAVNDANTALDETGLPFSPVNGSFQLLVHNKQTDTTTTTNIPIKLNGLEDDTTLTSLAASLNQAAGITATITSDNRLQISSNSPSLEFAFSNDTSGILASLGLNTFFSGSSSSNISVNSTLLNDPSKLAVSSGGIGMDTNNALALAALNDKPLDSFNGQSLSNLYDNFIADTAQSAAAVHSQVNGYQSFYNTLQSQQLSISGVSIDEETVKMMSFQRAYQASASLIKTVNTLLDTLVNL